MAFVWDPDEDAILRRHIAGDYDVYTALDMLPRRTLFAIEYRVRHLKGGGASRSLYEPPKPQHAPGLPKGVSDDAIAWAKMQPIGSRYHRDAWTILGWAKEGPVRL